MSSHVHFCKALSHWRRVVAWVALWLIVGTLFARAGDTPATNSPPRWPSLAEVLKRWDALPVADVERAAGDGEPTAGHYLGYCYTQGHRLDANAKLGVQWYERAGKNGYAPSLFNLGLLCGAGQGVPEDLEKAKHLIEAAAEAGLVNAQLEWAWLEERGWHFKPMPEGVAYSAPPVNWPVVIKWYRRAADQDNVIALNQLGYCYRSGRGVRIDEERCLECFRRAADLGDEPAALELVDLYSRGIGEPRNESDRPCEILLGLIKKNPQNNRNYDQLLFRYQNGLDGSVDLPAAAEMYCRAARAGASGYSLRDKVEVGPRERRSFTSSVSDPEGYLLSPDITLRKETGQSFFYVLSLYLKSARGDGAARLKLGEAYLAGKNAPASPARAWAWFTLAAERNAPDARRRAAAAEALMTPDELTEARELPEKIARNFDWVAALIVH